MGKARAAFRLLPNALKPLTDMMLRGIGCADDPDAARHVAASVASASPGARYFRMQPPIVGDVGPFEHDEAKLRAMEERTRQHFRASPMAAELCSRLVESRRGPQAEAGTHTVKF